MEPVAWRADGLPETIQNEESTRKRMESLKSPERAAKIGAAKRGIPLPDHVKEAIARAKTGSKATQQTRLKMSEAGEENPTLDKRAVMS